MAEDVRVVAYLHCKPGQEAAVRAAALACVAPTRAEPGNRLYTLNQDTKDPAALVFVEHWDSQQALDQHMQTQHFKTLAAALAGKLAAPLAVHVLAPV